VRDKNFSKNIKNVIDISEIANIIKTVIFEIAEKTKQVFV